MGTRTRIRETTNQPVRNLIGPSGETSAKATEFCRHPRSTRYRKGSCRRYRPEPKKKAARTNLVDPFSRCPQASTQHVCSVVGIGRLLESFHSNESLNLKRLGAVTGQASRFMMNGILGSQIQNGARPLPLHKQAGLVLANGIKTLPRRLQQTGQR
jgi:hypothetical protein